MQKVNDAITISFGLVPEQYERQELTAAAGTQAGGIVTA
jgi:hypothetical protein